MKLALDHAANTTATGGTVALLAAADPWVRLGGLFMILVSGALVAWRLYLTYKYGPLDEDPDDSQG